MPRGKARAPPGKRPSGRRPSTSPYARPSLQWPKCTCSYSDIYEYLNLAILLKGNVDIQLYNDTAMIQTNLLTGQLELKPKVVKEPVRNIQQWTDAFIIFMHVYLQKYSSRMLELLQYMSTIRKAAARCINNFAWRTYDEQFRCRQFYNSASSWATINADLWLLTVGCQSNISTPMEHAQNKVTTVPHFCFDYNKHQCLWKHCKYAHNCSKCKKPGHPAFRCQGQGQSNTKPFRPFPPKSGKV